MPTLEVLQKHKAIPFINGATEASPNWLRIGKSTICELSYNPQTETYDFIENRMPTVEVESYQLSMEQELQLTSGDPAFEFLAAWFRDPNAHIGENASVDFLWVWNIPSGADFYAWRCDAKLTLNNYNTVDKKMSFNISITDYIQGTAAVTGEGAGATVVFTP